MSTTTSKNCNHASDHQRQAVAWAAGTLRMLGVFFDANDCGGWDIETPDGWVVADGWREFVDVASAILRGRR